MVVKPTENILSKKAGQSLKINFKNRLRKNDWALRRARSSAPYQE